jgi:hypothetical protein
MNLVEFIGFVVSLVALFFLFFKQVYEDLYRKRHPEKAAAREREKHARMRALLKTINPEAEEDELEDELPRTFPRATPPPLPQRKPSPPPKPMEKRKKSYVEAHSHEDAYMVQSKVSISRAYKIVQGLQSPRNMVLFQEILSPPLALRNDGRTLRKASCLEGCDNALFGNSEQDC